MSPLGYRIATLAGTFGVVSATALAAATPLTPPPGAYIESPPYFTWTLPSTERSDALYIASKPETTADGLFVKANVERAHAVAGSETSWSPVTPLYAGAHWWLVSSSDRKTGQRYSSAPLKFTLAVSFEFDRSVVRRSPSQHWLRLTPHWSGNMRTVIIKVSLLLGRRIVWSRRALRKNRIGSRGSVSFTWHRPDSIKQGTAMHVREGFSVPGSSAGGGDGFGVKAP
jgi:hypothetical protein